MKANKNTIKLLGIAIVFTLVTTGLYTALYVAIKNKTAATTPLLEKVDELAGRESRITASLATLRKQSENIDKISAVFFHENEIIDFTKKIEALGDQSGTKLTLESLEQGVTGTGGPSLSFRIQATGKFADIERLLIILENFPGKLDWRTVSLNHSGDTAGESLWSMSLSLKALNMIN
ncbi:MAG: hypothetical protein WC791_04010 [Candidatus Paceibacterota bacterium]|jgi:hypothetical protein